MKIGRDLVLHVARLARLELSDAEVSHYETQLGRIVDFMSVLDKVQDEKTSANALAGALDWQTAGDGRERPDLVEPSLPADVAVAGAAEVHDTSFQVPKIIE